MEYNLRNGNQMSDYITKIKDQVVDCLRNSTKMKTYHDDWDKSNKLGGHVFVGLLSVLNGGKNRGRMPFIEIEVSGDTADDINTDTTMTNVTVTIRGWVINNIDDSNLSLLSEIMINAVQEIKSANYDTATGAYLPSTAGALNYRNLSYTGPDTVRVVKAIYQTIVINIEIPVSRLDFSF